MSIETIKAEAKTYIYLIEGICEEINDSAPGTCTFECGDYDEDSSMVLDDLAFLGFEGPWCRVTAGKAKWYADCGNNQFEGIIRKLRTIAEFIG